MSFRRLSLFLLIILASACSAFENGDHNYPDPDYNPNKPKGKLFGEGGLTLFDTTSSSSDGSGPSIGVNVHLWRASLETLSSFPIVSADPFGGTIVTDWYSPAGTPDERFKVNLYILDQDLRPEALKVSVFKQAKDKKGVWQDAKASDEVGQKLEQTILAKARDMKARKTMDQK